MPLYEYFCENCRNKFESYKKMNDPNNDYDKCDVCGKKCKRIISMSSFVLKGNGWYTTDYKNKTAK